MKSKPCNAVQDAEEELQAVEKASVGHSAAEDEKASVTACFVKHLR